VKELDLERRNLLALGQAFERSDDFVKIEKQAARSVHA
jgi:hypothetical protein